MYNNMRLSMALLLLTLIVCHYSIVSINCSQHENTQSHSVRDISGRSRGNNAATFGKTDGDDDDESVPNLADDTSRTHRTSQTSSSSTTLTASSSQPAPRRSTRQELPRSTRMRRSDWDDSVMSWMKRLDVRKLSPGSGEQITDGGRRVAAPAVAIRTMERANPIGLENKRNFDDDMAWLKRSGRLTNWDLTKLNREDERVAHRPDIRSWDESDMSWMKRSSERVDYPFDERVAGGSKGKDYPADNLPEAIGVGNIVDEKLAEQSDVDEPHDDKRKWKSDVTWIKK